MLAKGQFYHFLDHNIPNPRIWQYYVPVLVSAGTFHEEYLGLTVYVFPWTAFYLYLPLTQLHTTSNLSSLKTLEAFSELSQLLVKLYEPLQP